MKNIILILGFFIMASLTFAQGADVTADAKLGTAVTFSIESVSGTPPFTYQWHKNGVFIPGATGATYTIPAADVSSAGTYFVQVMNSAGKTNSSNGILTVTLVTVAPGVATLRITFTPAK